MSDSDEALPIVFAKIPNTITSELGAEQPEAIVPLMIDLENERRSISNKNVIYSTPGLDDLEKITTRKWPHNKSDDFLFEEEKPC